MARDNAGRARVEGPGGRTPIDQYFEGKSLEGIRDDILDVNFPDRMDRQGIAEWVARQFHETYERLAPAMGYQTREASAVAWEDVPDVNKQLMIAVAYDLLERRLIEARPPQPPPSREGRPPMGRWPGPDGISDSNGGRG